MSKRLLAALFIMFILAVVLIQHAAQSSYKKCMTKKSHEQCKDILDFAHGE